MTNKGFDIKHNKTLTSETGEKHLLLIGIDKYPKGFTRLYNCVEDIKAFKRILTSYYGFDENNCTILENENATRYNILKRVKEHRKLKEEDQLIIYFSGHGDEIDDVGYWIPVDAEKDNEFSFIPSFTLLNELRRINCMHIFLIIDACFSGSFLKILKGNKDSSAKNEAIPSRYCLTASHQTEVADDGMPNFHSPFAKALIEYLEKQEEPVSTYDIGHFVMTEVEKKTKGEQNPIYGELDLPQGHKGKFILYPTNEILLFENISKLVEDGKRELAANKLFLHLKNNGTVPDHLMEKFSLISNKVRKLSYLDNKELIDTSTMSRYEFSIKNDIAREISTLNKYSEKEKNIKKDYRYHILSKVFYGDDHAAIDFLKKKCINYINICNELIKISARLKMLKEDVKRERSLSGPSEYMEESEQLIYYLTYLMDQAKEREPRITNKIGRDLFFMIKEISNAKALFFLREALTFEERLSEEWLYWVEYLDWKLQRISSETHLFGYENEKITTEKNKIKECIEYLFQKILEEAVTKEIIQQVESEESKKGNILPKDALVIKNMLAQNEIEDALSKCSEICPEHKSYLDKLKSDLIVNTRWQEAHFNTRNKGTVSRILRLNVVNKLLDFVDRSTHGVSLQKEKKHTPNELRNFYEEFFRKDFEHDESTTPREIIREIKKLVSEGSTGEAIKYLLSFKLSKENRSDLLFFKTAFDRNIEDRLFTDKDSRIVTIRESDIISKFLNLLNNISNSELMMGNNEQYEKPVK